MLVTLVSSRRYYQLRYEDLATSPEKVLGKIYKFIGLPFTKV